MFSVVQAHEPSGTLTSEPWALSFGSIFTASFSSPCAPCRVLENTVYRSQHCVSCDGEAGLWVLGLSLVVLNITAPKQQVTNKCTLKSGLGECRENLLA